MASVTKYSSDLFKRDNLCVCRNVYDLCLSRSIHAILHYMVIPMKKTFLELVKNGRIPPLHREITYSSPYLIYESLASPNSILLESVKGPGKIARYSFIGLDPYLIFKTKDGLAKIWAGGEKTEFLNKPLGVLKSLIGAYQQMPFDYLPPFQGGAAGVFGYDFVQYFERLPKNATDDLNLPDAHFLMVDRLIAFDHLSKKSWIIVCPGVRDSLHGKRRVDWSEKYDREVNTIEKILKQLKSYKLKVISEDINVAGRIPGASKEIDIVYEMKKKDYMDIVKKAKEYIAAGDIFQANLSQRVSAHIGNKSPWNLYKILRSINPAPFAAFMNFADYQIVSSSPERLVRVNNGTIDTRPIAGTRPRGRDSEEDEMMREELLLNEKERAEHIMLIDLERNDLGRVSSYGTVTVDEFMNTEDYSHVIHIVSNVKGNLAPGKDCFDAIKAAFPGGTITGVPKVRCMEIIDELEPVRRGPYTGSIGYIGFSGNMDLNIIIRTFIIKNDTAYVQAGAGIVADSNPEREYFEAVKKAEALIRTLGMVQL